MTEKKNSLTDHLFNLVLVGVLLYALAVPGGPLRTWFRSWNAERHSATLARENWPELSETSARIDASGAPRAKIIEFGNYECPYCQRVHSELESVMESNQGIAVGFRHYPMTKSAEEASIAAICAEFQGRFREANTIFFESGEWRSSRDWVSIAEEAGVPDLVAFGQCLGGEAARARLDEDLALAETLGVVGTPTFFFPTGVHMGYLDREQLAAIATPAR